MEAGGQVGVVLAVHCVCAHMLQNQRWVTPVDIKAPGTLHVYECMGMIHLQDQGCQ